MSRIDTVLLWVAPLLQLGLAAVLLWRKVVKRFPVFFTYTVFAIAAEFTKILVHNNFAAYFYVFIVTEPLYALLGYMAISEVFYRVFQNFQHFRWVRLLPPAVGVLALLFSVLIALVRPPVEAAPFLATMFVIEIIVRCLQFGMFFLVFGLAHFYDLFWRQHSFGIVAGFGLAAFGLLLSFMLRSGFGTRILFWYKFLPPVTYLLALVIWLISFLKPLPTDPLQTVRPLFTPDVMEQWAKQLKRLTEEIFKLCLRFS